MSLSAPRTFLALLIAFAPFAFAADADGGVRYASGPLPDRFDMTVVQNGPQAYEVDGKTFDFDGLGAEIKRAGAATVRVQGRGTNQDVLCVSTLGLETGSSVYLIGSDGKAKAVTWTTDAKNAQKVAKACRTP